jgi:hemerythrin superfamily protein
MISPSLDRDNNRLTAEAVAGFMTATEGRSGCLGSTTAKGRMEPMNIVELLKQDHAKVRELMAEMDESEASGAELKKLFRMLQEEVILHSKAEEKVLYSQLRKNDEEELQLFSVEGEIEHGLVEQMLTALSGSRGAGGLRWQATFKVLKELLEKHIEEEESEIFPQVEERFEEEELDKMGQKFEKQKSLVAETIG